MANLTISATFTQNSGQPATGLALNEIEMTLVRQNKVTGADETIWSVENPTEEIDGVGSYIRVYTDANLSLYNYFASIEYVGAVVLDTDFVTGTATAESVGAAAGTSTAVGIATPLPWTALSIFQWARIHGINPVHLAGGGSSTIFPPDQPCYRVWSRHQWQQPDQASWEDIILSIQDAEKTIAEWLGYKVAPQWTARRSIGKFLTYDRHFTNHINMQGQRGASVLQEGHVHAPGRRAVTEIATEVAVIYTDEDSDNFYETANITLPYTEDYPENEIKLFFADQNGDPRWEIRPIRRLTISGGELTVVVDAWQLTDPDVQARFPGIGGLEPLDLSALDYYVPTVDVYRVYNDTTAISAQLVWEKLPEMNFIPAGVGADEVTPTTQDGALIVRDHGIVAAIPAAYDTSWTVTERTVSRIPDKIYAWYYSGFISQEYEQGFTYDPLDSKIAMAIAYLSAARLNRDVCECGQQRIGHLREPSGYTSPAGNFLAVSDTVQACPFGHRNGEWLAYNMLKNPTAKRHIKVAVG